MVVSRSPLDVNELLKKLQHPQSNNEDGSHENLDSLSSPTSSSLVQQEKEFPPVTSPRKLKWQNAMNYRNRQAAVQQNQAAPVISTFGDLEQNDWHRTATIHLSETSMSAVNVSRIRDSIPLTVDDKRNVLSESRVVDAASSWAGAVAELDRRIRQMHESMAKLEKETADLTQQTIDLKEKSRGLLQHRLRHISNSEGKDFGFQLKKQQEEQGHSDDNQDERPKRLYFLPSTKDQYLDEESTQEQRQVQDENALSSLDTSTVDDALQSLSGAIRQTHENPMSVHKNTNNKTLWRRSDVEKILGDEEFKVDGLAGRRSKSTIRPRL